MLLVLPCINIISNQCHTNTNNTTKPPISSMEANKVSGGRSKNLGFTKSIVHTRAVLHPARTSTKTIKAIFNKIEDYYCFK
jgi:hypothetical protein